MKTKGFAWRFFEGLLGSGLGLAVAVSVLFVLTVVFVDGVERFAARLGLTRFATGAL